MIAGQEPGMPEAGLPGTVDDVVADEVPVTLSPRRRTWRRFWRDWTAMLGLFLVVGVCLVAVLAPWIAPYDPQTQDITNGLNMQGEPIFHNAAHLLGTDAIGRDVLSRLMFGARVSLVVGLLANGIAVAIGTIAGLVSGYARGIVEAVIMRITDIMMGFPVLLFAVALSAVLSPGLGVVIFVIGISFWTGTARIVHGEVLSIAEQEYVAAARALGCSAARILVRHILPQLVPTLLVYGTLGIASAILFEATLSFLGLSVQPPTPSWGAMAFDGSTYYRTAPWLMLLPGICIFLTVLGFSLLGDGLRDALDPKSERL